MFIPSNRLLASLWRFVLYWFSLTHIFPLSQSPSNCLFGHSKCYAWSDHLQIILSVRTLWHVTCPDVIVELSVFRTETFKDEIVRIDWASHWACCDINIMNQVWVLINKFLTSFHIILNITKVDTWPRSTARRRRTLSSDWSPLMTGASSPSGWAANPMVNFAYVKETECQFYAISS